jgi:outer membrane receptor protein involved in Fe transport
MIKLFPRSDGTPGVRFGNSQDHLDVAGWELELAAEPMEGLWLRAGYSYLHKTERDPQRFPSHSGSFIINYRDGDWNLNLSGYYRGKVEHEYPGGSTWLDDYWHLNSSLRYDLTPRLTLSATLRNLLNEEYGSPMRLFPDQDGLPARSRVFALEVDYALRR